VTGEGGDPGPLVAGAIDVEKPTFSKDAWNGQAVLQEVEMPVDALGTWVRIRELTAAKVSEISDAVTTIKGQRLRYDQKRRAVLTFAAGVIEPEFTVDEANVLQHQHGAAFTLVVSAIDEISGSGDEALEAAKQRFRTRPRR